MRRLIEEYWTDIHIKGGYELLYTPHIANVGLWKASGHFDFYNESMFDQVRRRTNTDEQTNNLSASSYITRVHCCYHYTTTILPRVALAIRKKGLNVNPSPKME